MGHRLGINGYFYLLRNTDVPYGACAVNAMASYPTKERTAPSPLPTPGVPPPPSPEPVYCDDFSYCSSDETCCCVFELANFCLIYGCCELEIAVCCTGSLYCCPSDYPIYDVDEGLCLQISTQRRELRPAPYRCPVCHHRVLSLYTATIFLIVPLTRHAATYLS